jgi:hypothetical protein
LKKYYPSIEVDHWLLLQASETWKVVSVREEASFRTKILTKGKWPILKCIALSTKIFCIANILTGSFIDSTAA